MPKLTRKKIARGVKLKPSHVYDPIGAIATQLTSPSTQIPTPTAGVTKEQYNKENSIFRMNWSIPYIGSEWTRTNGLETPYVIPFSLVHLQEFWNPSATSDELTPVMKLVEISYGFDQRDEGGLVTDQWCGVGAISGAQMGRNYDTHIGGAGAVADLDAWAANLNSGKIYAARDDSLKSAVAADLQARGPLTLSLHKKDASYYAAYVPGDSATSLEEIYNLPVPMSALIGKEFKANPSVVTGLNIPVDPYATYMLGIRPPRLHDDRAAASSVPANLALVNLTVSLKFKHVLVQRDSTALTDNPRNLPEHNSLKVADSITITTPAAGSPIEAETADGVQTNLEAIDRPFHDKLQGGLSSLSDRGVVEHVCEDAGYEVIAIPMWNNQWNNQLTVKHIRDIGTAPYQGGVTRTGNAGRVDTTGNTDLDSPVCDRAIIPISFPMTIHHVIVAHNALTTTLVKGEHNNFLYKYTQSPVPANAANAGWTNTSAATVNHKIGIAAGRGIRGGEYEYKAIALYDGRLGADHNIDSIRMNYNTTTPVPSAAQYDFPDGKNDYNLAAFPEWTLNYIPLSTGGAVAPGLYTTAGVQATPATFQNIQGPPMFVGNSYLSPKTSGGTTVAAGASVGTSVRITTPETQDEWLEVRWAVYPNGSAAGDDWLNNWTGTDGDQARIVNGYGGSWIYIIGKKHTVSDQNWQKPYHKKGL